MTEHLYYGCDLGHAGHFWHPSAARRTCDPHGHPDGCPFGYDVDGWVQPADPREVEGRCRIETRVNATGPWTCIGWWDRSGDTRPGSCSAFVAKGAHDFAAMLVLLNEAFPWVVLRCKFPLVHVDEAARPRSRR